MEDHRRESVRNTSVFSAFTGLSRILGLVRDILKASAFGTSIASVAFDIAFRLPNILRNLVAEGALSQSLIPVYNKYRKKSEHDGKAAIAAVLGFFAVSISALVVVAYFALPYAVPVFVRSAATDTTGLELTISLARLLFPYILFMSLASIYMAAQYSHGIFWAASLGPALLNLVIIIGFGAYYFGQIHWGQQDQMISIYYFAGFTLFAGLIQMLFQRAMSRRYSISAGMSLKFNHPVIKDIFFMMLPALFSVAVQEIGQLIDIFLATGIERTMPGVVSALTYSHRLIQLPIGIFGVAVATTSLSQLSKLFIENKIAEYKQMLIVAIRLNLYLTIPAILGLMIFSEAIVGIIFERGSFGQKSTLITAYALKFYAPGILAYSLQKLFLSALYARGKSGTPAVITTIVLVLNISISLALIPFLQHGGLALGSAMAAYVGVGIYLAVLKKKELLPKLRVLFSNTWQLFLLMFFLAGLMLGIRETPLPRNVQLLAAMVLSFLVFVFLSRLLKIPEYQLFKQLISSFARRFRRAKKK